jgi:hypothetical protein
MATYKLAVPRPPETSPSPIRDQAQQQRCHHCHQVILTAAERLDRIDRFKAIVSRVVVESVRQALEQAGRR